MDLALQLGERTIDGDPLPEFIGARPEILPDIIDALIETNTIMRKASLDAVLQAAATAFGFIYVHPFEDTLQFHRTNISINN